MPESSFYQEVGRERYGDLAEELANPQTSKSQIAAIERKNHDEAFRSVNARELIAHVVAQHRERFSENLRAGRRKAARRPYTTYAKRKPRVARPPVPEPSPCRVEGHWAQLLLDYVRRDHEVGRRLK